MDSFLHCNRTLVSWKWQFNFLNTLKSKFLISWKGSSLITKVSRFIELNVSQWDSERKTLKNILIKLLLFQTSWKSGSAITLRSPIPNDTELLYFYSFCENRVIGGPKIIVVLPCDTKPVTWNTDVFYNHWQYSSSMKNQKSLVLI